MKGKFLASALVTCFALAAANAAAPIDYPEDYRQWTHIKTMTLHEGHPLENPFKGIHHVYGNPKGVEGTKTGTFKDGAVLVFDLLENQTQDNASVEGPRVLIGVMVRDQKKYASTGGWGFEAWKGNSRTERIVNDGGKSCYDCHASQQDTDYVFSRWRD
jgi:hypothetical protein